MEENKSRFTLVSPFVVTFLSLWVSAAGCAAITGYMLWKLRYGIKSIVYFLVSGLLLSLQVYFVFSSGLRWQIIVPVFAVYNLVLGIFLPLVYLQDYRLYRKTGRGKSPTAGVTRLAVGIVSGAVIGFGLFSMVGVLIAIVFDYLFSTFLPVNQDLPTIIVTMFFHGLFGVLAGMWVGGTTAFYLYDKDEKLFQKMVISTFITVFFLSAIHKIFFQIPLFQVLMRVTVSKFFSAMVYGILFSFILFCIPAIQFLARSTRTISFIFRSLLVLLLVICLNFSWVLYSGMLRYNFLTLGNVAERYSRNSLAMKLYEKSLQSYPDEYTQSYLKYKIGVLHHKKGELKLAATAFQEVVSKYNADEDRVRWALKFLENYEKGLSPHRVVIPGIRVSTEFKRAYCAPNSFALVYNYWGIKYSAKELGHLFTHRDSGTLPIDELYYSVNAGFKCFVFPLNTIETIKKFIDLKIPVLASLPGHILVIYGYDDLLNTFVAYDTAQRNLWVEYPYDDFEKKWKKRFNHLTVLLPPGKKFDISIDLKKWMEKNTEAYFHYLLATETDLPKFERSEHFIKSMKISSDLFFVPIHFLATRGGSPDTVTGLIDLDKVTASAEKFFLDGFKNYDFLEKYCLFLERYGLWERILEFLSELDKKEDLNDRLRILLSIYQLRNGNISKAIANINELYMPSKRKFTRFQRKFVPLLYLNAALELEKTGNYPQAYKYFERFLRLMGKSIGKLFPSAYYYNIAATRLLKLGYELENIQSTKETVKEYLVRYPHDLETCYEYAVFLSKTGEPNDKKMIEKYVRRIIAIAPDTGLKKNACQLINASCGI